MVEDDIRFAVDSFNRFRRPNAEARIIEIDNKTAVIEFIGGRDKIDYYVGFFKDELESILDDSINLESVEKDGTCIARFSIHKSRRDEEDPLQKALRIFDKYYEGAPKTEFGFED